MTNLVTQFLKKAGGAKQLADQLGVTTQAVSLWQRQGYFPLRRFNQLRRLYKISNDKLVNAFEKQQSSSHNKKGKTS